MRSPEIIKDDQFARSIGKLNLSILFSEKSDRPIIMDENGEFQSDRILLLDMS